MRVWRMFKNWRRGYWRPFEVNVSVADVAEKLNVAEYELQCLTRDLVQVGCKTIGRRDAGRSPPLT